MGVEPCLARSSTVLLLAVGRQRHEEHPAPERGPDAPADLVAVDAREPDVDERDIRSGRQEIVDGLEAVDGDEVGSLALDALAHLQQRLLGAMLGVLGALVAFVDEHQSTDFILLMAVSPILRVSVMSFFCQRLLLTWPTHARLFVWHVPAPRADDPALYPREAP